MVFWVCHRGAEFGGGGGVGGGEEGCAGWVWDRCVYDDVLYVYGGYVAGGGGCAMNHRLWALGVGDLEYARLFPFSL